MFQGNLTKFIELGINNENNKFQAPNPFFKDILVFKFKDVQGATTNPAVHTRFSSIKVNYVGSKGMNNASRVA